MGCGVLHVGGMRPCSGSHVCRAISACAEPLELFHRLRLIIERVSYTFAGCEDDEMRVDQSWMTETSDNISDTPAVLSKPPPCPAVDGLDHDALTSQSAETLFHDSRHIDQPPTAVRTNNVLTLTFWNAQFDVPNAKAHTSNIVSLYPLSTVRTVGLSVPRPWLNNGAF